MSSESELAAFYGTRLDEFERAARRSLDAPADALRYSDNDEWAEGLAGLVHEDFVLRDVEAKRLLLADLLAERHYVSDDAYYTCPAATLERDGGVNPRAARGEWSGSELDCDCGRDDRVKRRLEILVSPYGDSA